jgi:hypothetical protein
VDKRQSQRIERLERYVRSLGIDPDEVTQSRATSSTTIPKQLVTNDVFTVGNTPPRQHVSRQRDASSSIATASSRSSKEARLVEHDKQTTYIETFVLHSAPVIEDN